MPKNSRRSLAGVTALVIMLAFPAAVGLVEPAIATDETFPSLQTSIPASIDPVDPHTIPLGDGHLSTHAEAGSVFSCKTTFRGRGAHNAGPWLDLEAGTWDGTAKTRVEGSVSWTDAVFQVQVIGTTRTFTGNDLPIGFQATGTFPIAPDDPAYGYDRNPNRIEAQAIDLSLPAFPSFADAASCLPMGPVGILLDGVLLFDALDAKGLDGGAHETLDACDGHPAGSGVYHHHGVPSCLMDQSGTPSTSTLVGYAFDGFGIYIERDANGRLLTNANLDDCHGRTGEVIWDGAVVEMYHYVATAEYPYVIGCYRGSDVDPL